MGTSKAPPLNWMLDTSVALKPLMTKTEEILKVREASERELLQWDVVASQFSNCRIFHKKAWLSSIEHFSNAKPLYLIFERSGQILGCMPGFLIKIGFVTIYASPREGWQTESMGPVFDSTKVSSRELIGNSIQYLERNHGVHHIELSSPDLDHAEMESLGFSGRKLFTYRVRLFPENQQLAFKNMKRNTQSQVRKSIRQGLVAAVETDEAFVAEFYDQTKEVFARHRLSVPFTQNRALQCFRAMRDSGNLLAIAVRTGEGKTIATGIFMIDGRELSFWGWTHRTDYRWYCPSELLLWTAMQKGMEAGCATFDMAGRGDAKLKFGAEVDETNYQWIRSRYFWIRMVRLAAKRVFKLQQSLRGYFLHRQRFGFEEREPGAIKHEDQK